LINRPRAWANAESSLPPALLHPDGSTIEITFDEQGRVAQFGGQIKPR
jgi:hypothetical protein